MATKRMFSLNVVDTDSFLEMPMSARLLYYDLGMRADDDGFIGSCKKILLFTGAKEDDLRVLITKGFVIPFENGVIVIRHWKMNNYLQNDRIKPTIYQQEYNQLSIDSSGVYNLYTDCIHSIDKTRLDEISIDNKRENKRENHEALKKAKTEVQVLETEFSKLWELYPNKVNEAHAKQSYLTARNSGVTYEEISNGLINYLDYVKNNKFESRYIKQGDNWFKEQCWKNEYKITNINEEKVPNWYKKEAKKEEASIEEQQELEKLMNGLEDDNVG